ncbi:hypothetical protein Taro_017853 [Colocasia esculenta]|uniref:Uncharacterized protein n=1 Tax=Colocasia esculenta TaxID=4460 RepID=A0A843UP74_COLES|nr:hypothetical protein [Colocasia esculenta]
MVTPDCSFPTSWRSGMFGACVMRLWSHVVAPVFRELLCLGGCMPRVCFRIVFDFAGSAGVGRVDELLVAEELWNNHKKLIFFPFSSAATCTNRPLEIDQRRRPCERDGSIGHVLRSCRDSKPITF